MIQFNINRFRLSQKIWWHDSGIYDPIQHWIDSELCENDSHKIRDSMWYDSNICESIHAEETHI